MDKREKKRLAQQWRAEQRAKARAAFPVPAEELEGLFDMLDRELPIYGCDHTRRLTKLFLEVRELPVAEVFAWLDTQGGFCDCEVLNNVEPEVEDALHGLKV